jgi:long-chain acyl-CoA synthetase
MDRCRIILTGAAPCPPYLIEFLKVVTGAIVIQGYGMTETAATISVTSPTDINVGHVGPPLPNCEVKLRDVPELGYLSTDEQPRGELLVRGPCVFKGYFKDEEATKDCLTSDGWMCTGDVARWNPNGTLSIIDRRRNIFKLPQGEYVAAEKIEITLGKAPIVGQIWVYGNGFKTFLLGVVVPSMEVTYHFCQEKGWWPSAEKPVYGSEAFIKQYRGVWDGSHAAELKAELMNNLNLHSAQLKGFEKLKDVLIETDINQLGLAFTEENECMTPTFKLRRVFLLKRYHEKLKKVFEDNGEPNAADEKWPGLK